MTQQTLTIQIYTMQTPDEARAVAAAGVHHLGVTPSACGLPGEVSFDTARAICAAAPPGVTTVALSVETEISAIVRMVRAVAPDVLHLCALEGAVPPETVAALRTHLPGVPVMQAISVGGPDAIQTAQAYQAVADYLILDTQAPDIAGIGASGQTHDWSISRAIVAAVRVPVILAGGLSPENVADAVRAVRPWGVDSLTHTNAPLPGGGFRKDMARVAAFVAAAQGALA